MISSGAAQITSSRRVEWCQSGSYFASLFEALGHNPDEAKELAVSLSCELTGAVALARAVDPEQAREIRASSRTALRKRFGLRAPVAA